MASPIPPPPPPPPRKPLHYFDLPEWPTKKRNSGNRPKRLSQRARRSASSAAKGSPTEKVRTILSRQDSSSSSPASHISGKGSGMDVAPTGKNSEPDDLSDENPGIRIRIPSLGFSRGESVALGHEKVRKSQYGVYEFVGTNISEKESSCIDVLQNELHGGNITKEKPLEKNMPKTLAEKSQDSKFESLDSTFLRLINKVVADLSATSNSENQGNKSKHQQMEIAENDITRASKPENKETIGSTMTLRPRQHQKPLQIEKTHKESGVSSEDRKGSDKKKSKMQQNKIDKNKDTCKNNKGKNIKDNKKEEIKKEIKWPKFRLQLTPEEIEEDLYAMTGKKPPRKIKKRPKNIQKSIEHLALGAELEYITPESYEVNENARKGK